ncbi:MAG TPA: MBL fold metallo-hydrolase [Paracoccaceae bacterium]|nr:MBL fold metallo-hydrolase [Paracoccaceae bacterium]
MNQEGATVRVWGCRGSLPVPGAATQRYGGDTSCYEIRDAAGYGLLIDCGSGMRALGEAMMQAGPPAELDILLSHAHFDHLIGLGFFMPLLKCRTALRLWTTEPVERIAAALQTLFGPPLWPMRIPGDYPLPIHRLAEGVTQIGPARVEHFPLHHPGGASGFRISLGGRMICSVTDHEHGQAGIDAGVRQAVKGADLMLYDAAYSEAEYAHKQGWGHSTWEEAQRVAEAAGVKHTLLVHHSPPATDDELDAKHALLSGARVRVTVARDGMEIAL